MGIHIHLIISNNQGNTMDPDLRRGDERVCGNDKSGVCSGYYSPLSSRAKRGDPVNKKGTAGVCPQTYCTGLPQSYDNVFNVDRTPSQ